MTDALLIRGGIVVDGTGSPARPADVLIQGDTIVTVGQIPETETPDQVIDVDGAVVAPGFVDLHTHADYTLLAFPSADSAVRQGITTVAVGNCGGGMAPISDDHDIRSVAFAYRPEWGVPVDWRSFPEYLDRLDGLGVNVAAMVPQGALRNAVMGVVPRPATDSEMDRMTSILREAMEAGAVGMSTGLQYRPGCWAQPTEIRRLVEVVGESEGIYATHMRDRSDRYVAAIDEAIAAAVGTGAHLQLSHVVARPDAPAREIEGALAELVRANADMRLGVDTFPEPWGPGLLVDLFPTDLMEGSTDEVLARLTDPTLRSEMEEYIAEGRSFLARACGYDGIFFSSVPDRDDLNGAALSSVGPVGTFCVDVLVEAGHQMREVGIRHVYAHEKEMDRVIALPFCSIASDGIVTVGEDSDCPLVWSASSYGYTARFLEHYVRERRTIGLEDAVRRMTSLPAKALGLGDRGRLAAGKKADLVVFDPEAIHDRSTPTEMARYPTGLDMTIVNGSIVYDGARIIRSNAGRRVA